MKRSTLVWEIILLVSMGASLLAGLTYWMDHGLGKAIVRIQDAFSPTPTTSTH